MEEVEDINEEKEVVEEGVGGENVIGHMHNRTW